MKFVTQNYYEILGVEPGASSDEVKRAYRVVRQSFRPDSIAVHSLYSDGEAEAISSKIEEAFEVLSIPESASRYRRYHRASRVGRPVARDANAFFDEVHQLDDPTALEALARQMGGMPAVQGARAGRAAMAIADSPSSTPRLGSDDGPGLRPKPERRRPGSRVNAIKAMRAVESEEGLPLLSSLEEVVEDGGTDELAGSPPPQPALPFRPEPGPALPFRPEPGPALPFRPEPGPAHRVVPAATVSALRGATPPASPRPLSPQPPRPAPAMSGTVPGGAATASGSMLATAPAQMPQAWGRAEPPPRRPETVPITALPPETLEAFEVDAGGINGQFLRQVRLEHGVDLYYVSDQTKISRAMLHYIEEDELRHLPARVYLKGYLMHISRLFKLPQLSTTDSYLAGLDAG